MEHLFLLCSRTRAFWFGLNLVPPPNRSGLTSLNSWFMDRVENCLAYDDHGITKLCFALWNIWKMRNENIHEGHSISPDGVIRRVNTLSWEYSNDSTINSTPTQNPLPPRDNVAPCYWRPSFMKINSDPAFNISTGIGHIGVICRNDRGEILTYLTKRIFATSPLIAKALGLREATLLASNLQIRQVIMETDSQALVEACRSKRNIGEIQALVHDINELRRGMEHCEITWIKREANSVAHELAALASRNLLHHDWQ